MKLILITACAITACNIQYADAKIKCAAAFDKDRNGIVEKGRELDVCLLHKTSETHSLYDKNHDGRIDRQELASMEAKVRDSDNYVTLKVDTEDDLAHAPGVKPTKPTPPPAPSDEKFEVKRGLILRKAYQSPSVLNAPSTDLKRVAGASFNYSHDYKTNTSTASGSGALMYYQNWDLRSGLPVDPEQTSFIRTGISAAALNIGFEFDRNINRANPAREIDVLTLRMGGELEFEGQAFNHYLRANIFDVSDFGFGAHVLGGSVEYEPVNIDLGIGVARKISGLPIYYRWRPVAHLEFQKVVDAAGSPVLASQPDLLFAGPILQGDLFFEGVLERLHIDATYWKVFDLAGNVGGFDYFEIGANWRLDDAGYVSLTTKYRTGNLPKNRQAVEDITAGLTVKF